MMEFLMLFWVFFQIGLFTIGGGHAMIPLIMEKVVAEGWVSEEMLIDFIAISESTPGPFAVNIATYTGTVVGEAYGGVGYGILGALCATFGVVAPSIIIIILIVKLFSRFMAKPPVQEVFTGVRSSVAGLLLSVFATLFLSVILGLSSVWDKGEVKFDYIGLIIFAVLFVLSNVKIKGKKMHPIAIVVLSALMGILMYGFIPS
jgi:chromate transporter